MIRKISCALFLVAGLFAGATLAVAQSADEVVKETANGVIDRIEKDRPMLESNPDKIYELVDELVIPHLDFISMSKWVLGKNWQDASESQRSEFIEQFKTLLVRTYARALLGYSDQQIKFYPAIQKANSNLAVVKTEFSSNGSQPFSVIYRMHLKDGAWKVVDVAVDGVSLVSTYRGSFANQIKKNGFGALIKQLADKNAKLASNVTN